MRLLFLIWILNISVVNAQCISDPTFNAVVCSGGTVMTSPNWTSSYGTPTCWGDIDASDATGAIWMWSYSSGGECIATPYSFVAGRTYRICARVLVTSTHPTTPGDIQFLTSTAVPTSIPIVSGSPVASSLSMGGFTIGTVTMISFDFTPSSNQDFLIIRPWQIAFAPTGADQSAFAIDDLYIIDLDHDFDLTLPSGVLCAGDPVLLSVVPEGCAGESIRFMRDGTTLCTNCSGFTDYPPAGPAVYKAIIERGIPGFPCQVDTVFQTAQIAPCSPLGPNEIEVVEHCESENSMHRIECKVLRVNKNEIVILEGSNDGIIWNSILSTQEFESELDELFLEFGSNINLPKNRYYRINRFNEKKEKVFEKIIESNCKSLGNSYSIYPNPSSGKIKINFSNEKSRFLNLEIFDQSGKLSASFVNISPQNNTIDTQLENGLYIVRMTDEFNLIAIQKLVIE